MWKFIKSSTNKSNWLENSGKEICFIGRSNVGKSSLINALVGSKIARTSSSPGRTRLVNFFQKNKMTLVDLPGYGYARMSKKLQWGILEMVEEYIQERQNLVKTFVLVDGKVGPTKDDMEIINFLKTTKKDFSIILTKSDKTNQSIRHKVDKVINEITNNVFRVSSLKKNGIAQLKRYMESLF